MFLYLLLALVLFVSDSHQGVKCGKKLNNRRFKINDGHRARHNSFPWAVVLVKLNSRGLPESVLCSGTLITNRHVITAAHCKRDIEKYRNRVSIVVGDSILKPFMSITIQEKFIHPKFLEPGIERYGYDIMILKLNDWVRSWYGVPICVNRYKNIDENYLYTIYGFGITADNDANKKLYYYKAKIEKHKNFLIAYTEDPNSNKHTCLHDSGGGLTQQIQGSERLAGVAFASSKRRCTREPSPYGGLSPAGTDVSMFGDIRNHFDFICNITNVGCQ